MMILRLLFLFIPALLLSLGAAWVIFPFLPYPFSRVFNRCLYVFGLVAVVFFQKKVRKKSFLSLGLNGNGTLAKDLFLGIAFSIVSFAVVTSLSLLFQFSLLEYHPPLPRKLMNYFLGSILIAFFEELFFRGFLLQTLMDDLSISVSVTLSSLIYSLAHFIRPLFLNQPEDLSLFYTESIGLFLFGALLSYAVLRTRSLYLAMGLHGGFVLLLKLDGIWVNRLMRSPAWIFGEERLVGGVVTWLVFLVAFPWVKALVHRRRNPAFSRQTS